MKKESKAKKIKVITPDISQTVFFDIKELAKTIEQTLGPIIQEQKRLNKMFANEQPAIQKMINRANQALKASGYPETVRQMNETRKQIERSMSPLKKLILPVIKQDYMVAPIRIMPPATKEIYSIQGRPQYDEKTIEKLIDKAVKEQIESRFSINGVPKKISTIRLPVGNPAWIHVKISLQENDCVRIYYKNNLVFQGDYESIGLYKKTRRGTEPSLEWKFLQKLSIFSGEFKGVKNKEGLNMNECRRTFSGASDASIHAIKSRLAKKLKATMGILDDPFYSYKEKSYYEPIFIIEPEPDLRSDRDLRLSGRSLPKNI